MINRLIGWPDDPGRPVDQFQLIGLLDELG
jgi:hypothetical protein